MFLWQASGEYVVSSVPSHHNKNLKRWTSVAALDGPVLPLRVTAQFYLENKGEYILEAEGMPTQKT